MLTHTRENMIILGHIADRRVLKRCWINEDLITQAEAFGEIKKEILVEVSENFLRE